MDAVGVHFEGQVGSIVEDEGHSVVEADSADEAGPLDERLRLKMLLAQLDDVHSAGDAGRDEMLEVGPIGCAEIQVAVRDGASRRHALALAFAFAFAFMACLCARTLARLSGPVMSATDRYEPSSPKGVVAARQPSG